MNEEKKNQNNNGNKRHGRRYHGKHGRRYDKKNDKKNNNKSPENVENKVVSELDAAIEEKIFTEDIPNIVEKEDDLDDVQLPENYNFDDDSILFGNQASKLDGRPATEVIGIQFKKTGKVYYFDANGLTASRGEFAIVETARGPEFGKIHLANRMVADDEIVQPLRKVIRIATKEDVAHNEENRAKENEAFKVANEKIAEHGLDMKLVDVQYTFDNSKLLFYFTSAGRVDFRELVKDLASVFRTRIELRQIGIRDEAKLIGGLGMCGRALCCASFLSDFGQVSIKMAKEQSLSLNSTKISGICGRLMCCLRYEHKTYEEEIRLTPSPDSVVKTTDGVGTVCEAFPLTGMISVKLQDSDGLPKKYHRDNVTVISRGNRRQKDDDADIEE